MGTRFYRQIFEPYKNTKLPVFVTSDTVLQAYHALFEQCLVRLERAHARMFAEVLPQWLSRLPSDGLAWKLLAVACELLAPEPGRPTAVTDVVHSIRAAQGFGKPAWLGAPDPGFLGLDYSRFQPVGIYTGIPAYFQAVRWLQSVPVRDEAVIIELRAALGPAVRAELTEWSGRMQHLAGPPDNPDVLGSEGRCLIADQVATAGEPSSRVLSALALPDQVCVVEPAAQARLPLEVGLAMCGALGSSWAYEWLDTRWHRFLPKADLRGRSLYHKHLHCLAALVEKPEVLTSEAWSAKCHQTAAGGWAQLRHALALHAKETAVMACLEPPALAGFVEPNPEFFKRAGELISLTHALFAEAGALEPDWRMALEPLDLAINLCGQPNRPFWLLQDSTPASRDVDLRRIQADLENGELQEADRDTARFIAINLGGLSWHAFDDLTPTWRELHSLTGWLAHLARLQLRGELTSESESLKDFGLKLQDLMLCSNAPNDDAPRVATIASDPLLGTYHHVGVGRPRALYVLYPWKGQEILCLGGVLPYHEFAHPSPLTDPEFRDLKPPTPEWVHPLLP